MIDIKFLENIGKVLEIKNSSDNSKIGLKGLVIFESKNIVVLRTKENKIKKLKKLEIIDSKVIN